MLTVASMFCLILLRPWDMWDMLKTLCFKILWESLRRDCGRLGFPEIACFCRVWWYPPITLALGKQAAGPTQVPVQPGIFSETLSQKKRKEKKSQPLSKCVPGPLLKMRQHWSGSKATPTPLLSARMSVLILSIDRSPQSSIQAAVERTASEPFEDNLLAKLGRNWWRNSVGRR